MYCRQCGTKNEDGAQFCGGCGAKMTVPNPQKNPPKEAPKKKKGKKIILIILAVLLLAAGIIAAVIIAMQKKQEKEFNNNIEKAENYLEDLKYEKAEDCYLAAIEIDPKEEEPYIRLAEIYNVQNEPEKAVEILEQGIEATESEEIQKKFNLYTYVEEVMIPEIGKAETGTYECEYKMENEYYGSVEKVQDLEGVITSKIKDFDNDGDEELLVAILKNDEESDSGEKVNAIYLEMYESDGDEITKSAEFLACTSVLGQYDEESSGVFLKTYEDTTYICGGEYGYVYMFADGSSFRSFVITYEDEEFAVYAGLVEGASGSEFSWLEEEKDEMADKLDAIDLPKAAADVRSTYMTRMTYEDEVDDMLFRIEGNNVGGNPTRFSRTKNISALGKLVIKFWCGEKVESEDGAGQEEVLKISEEELASLREELEELYVSTEADMEEASYHDMATMRSTMGDVNTIWSEELEYIFDIVCSYMSAEEVEALEQEQQEWEEESDAKAEEAAAPFEGGTMYSLEYAGTKYELMVERCHELLDMLE